MYLDTYTILTSSLENSTAYDILIDIAILVTTHPSLIKNSQQHIDNKFLLHVLFEGSETILESQFSHTFNYLWVLRVATNLSN